MRGRYGIMDSLNKFLMTCGLLLIFLTLFIHTSWLNLLGILLLLVAYWRILSRKIYQRAHENTQFQQRTSWLTKPLRSTSTTLLVGRILFSYRMPAIYRATSVLPVPGFPRKHIWMFKFSLPRFASA